MHDREWLRKVARKNANHERLAAAVVKQPDALPELLEGLSSDRASIKYGCAKILRIVSEKDPALLYPRIRRFFDLLDHDNQILRWNVIFIVGNLAVVDSRGKITGILDRYLAPIPGPSVVTAANVIAGAAEIALAKPRLTDRIVDALLKVEKARYRTPECRNVALGRAIEALGRLYGQTKRKRPVARLVRRQLENPRNSTRKKAERFAKRWLAPSPRGRGESPRGVRG